MGLPMIPTVEKIALGSTMVLQLWATLKNQQEPENAVSTTGGLAVKEKKWMLMVNPDSSIKECESIDKFVTYLEPFLQPQSIQERLPPSDVVGNIRFSHPTLYVFPGGQGDSALFGINGFNMLIDGGFSRKACFWDFTRHLDRLDAILVTRMSDENTQGISAVLERKSAEPAYPQIGQFFANIIAT